MINFKANSGILHHYMKGINPHDEIKGSNPSPGAYFEGTRGYTLKPMRAKIHSNWDLNAQTSTIYNHEPCAEFSKELTRTMTYVTENDIYLSGVTR